MAASSDILTCISSAFPEAEWWINHMHDEIDVADFKDMQIALRTLKLFVIICTLKLPDHDGLGSFLLRMKDLICAKAEELHACRVDVAKLEANEYERNDSDSPLYPVDRAINVAASFPEFIQKSVEEIRKWYVAVLDCFPQSNSFTGNEVLEIISDVIENMSDERFKDIGYDYSKLKQWSVGQGLFLKGQYVEQVMFLKSLIQFVNQASFEACENLLAYAGGIAINFAYLLFRNRYDYNSPVSSEMSTLLQKTRPVDPRVHEMYTGALTSFKLSGKLPDSAAMKNFLDSLISNLWEILRMDTLSKKDQLKVLYEGLRSLRSAVFIKQPTARFEEQIEKNIAHLVCDAGIYLCSFYQARTDDDLELQQLLEILKTLLVDVGDKDPHRLMLNSSKPSSYAYVDFILKKMLETKCFEAESTGMSYVETIQRELASVRSLLGKMVDMRNEQVEIQFLWDRLLEVAYEVEDKVDSQDSFSTSFDSLMNRISNIKADALKIELKDIVRRQSISHVPSKSERAPSRSNEVIGFEDEERRIINRLRGGSQRLEVISVVGMPGLGKTTLATKVFKDPCISRHFSTCAWCPISQVLDKKKVLINILEEISRDTNYWKITEDDLANKLRQGLKGKRYLIYLDDIWNIEAWDSLKGSFPDDNMQSRIILTSRSHEMPGKDPIILSELSMKESMQLLERRLFPGEGNGWPVELHDLGMKMAGKCKGLPLSIVVLAGVLENVELEDWQKILDGFSFVSVADSCKHTLELSHKHLPDHIKPCLLYFGAFPEDEEIQVKRLLRLWIAEGFVRKSETKSLEDVAEDYLTTLIGRSLIMAAKRRSDGGVKTCRIHDLLRDFCLQQSKDEHFFHFVVGRGELLSFNEPRNLRRLWVESEPEHIKGSKLICPHARSFHLSSSHQSPSLYRGMSGMLHFCKLLKVLDLEQIRVHKFPSIIRQLVLLVFLAIRGKVDDIPSWIDDLSRLETLIIIHFGEKILFPDSLWNLQKLKHLYLNDSYLECARLPRENLEKSSVLYDLDGISGVSIHWGIMERQLRKFPNVRRLKFRPFLDLGDHTEYPDEFVFPTFLSRLEALTMLADHKLKFGIRFGFKSLTSLKKLNLSGFE